MRRAITTALLATSFVVPTAAFADSPAQGGYGSTPIAVPPTQVEGASATSSSPSNTSNNGTAPTATASVTPTRSTSSGSLPFTGLDLGLVVALAVGLMGLGYALRRTTTARQDS